MVMFSIISMDFFQLEAAQAGYLMSFFGILQMVSGCRTHWACGLPALPGSQGLADHPPVSEQCVSHPAHPPFGCSIHTLASGLSPALSAHSSHTWVCTCVPSLPEPPR